MREPTNEKIQRLSTTAERLARQMGATFVPVDSKRADYERRERAIAGSDRRNDHPR